MSKVRVIKRGNSISAHRRTKYEFYCPGCEEKHVIDDRWSFNGNTDAPTFGPSVNRQLNLPDGPKTICHSFIKDGKIRFLNDCTHDLAGQTVELPDLGEK